MIAKLLLQNTAFVIAMAVLLFACAGTLHWPGAWVFLIASAVIGPASGLWLARTDPALLERSDENPIRPALEQSREIISPPLPRRPR